MKARSVGAKSIDPDCSADRRSRESGEGWWRCCSSGGGARTRPPLRAVTAHPSGERERAATQRQQEQHPAALVRAPVAVLVFAHPLFEHVEDPVVLGPGLLDLLAEQLVLEPEPFSLLALTIQALLEHPVLHPVARGPRFETRRGAVALHRAAHVHADLPGSWLVSGYPSRPTPNPASARGDVLVRADRPAGSRRSRARLRSVSEHHRAG